MDVSFPFVKKQFKGGMYGAYSRPLPMSDGDSDEWEVWVQYAIFCGAKKADLQYSEDGTVLLDPEGHPFYIDPP